MERDLIYDIGMHKGEDSAYYLAKGYRVVGFEANPDLAAECRARFAGNGRHSVVEGAISDSAEPTIQFYKHPISVWGTIESSRADLNSYAGASELVETPTINLAKKLEETGIPAYFKVDIEGADLHCLETLLKFEERPTHVSIEASFPEWDTLQAEFSLLDQLGYNRFSVVQQATVGGSEIDTLSLAGEPLHYRFEDHASGPFGDDLSDWVTRSEALRRYEQIRRTKQRVRRPEAFLLKSRIGRGVRGQAMRLLGPLPGWFDTHATRV